MRRRRASKIEAALITDGSGFCKCLDLINGQCVGRYMKFKSFLEDHEIIENPLTL